MKNYTRMPMTQPEFELLHSSLHQSRQNVFERWKAAKDAHEKTFYAGRVDEYDALLAKFQRVLEADTSQDAEE